MTVIAGIGCRRDCAAETIEAVLRMAEDASGRAIGLLAVPAFKAGEAGVATAAARLGLVLMTVDADALAAAQPRCPTMSATAQRSVGVGSVAEGCALAASGVDGRLILPRIAHGGATCALAERP